MFFFFEAGQGQEAESGRGRVGLRSCGVAFGLYKMFFYFEAGQGQEAEAEPSRVGLRSCGWPLAFMYCNCQNGMVYGMHKAGRVGVVYCAIVVP